MSGMRLTDSARWDYAWFSGLPTEMKLLFVYVEDHTDLAAVWPVNKGLAEYHIGSRIDWGLVCESYHGQVTSLASGEKWFLPNVLARRYPAGLGASHLHVAVRNLLTLHKIDDKQWQVGGPMGPPPRPQTPPASSSSDFLGGGVEGERVALTPKILLQFLKKKNLADDESALDEWIGFLRKRGAKTAEQAVACLDWCVRAARRDGVLVRYKKHLDAYGDQWRDMKRETERIEKKGNYIHDSLCRENGQ